MLFLLIFAVIMLTVGVLAFLCWKNQMIVIRSEEDFYYRTFIGNVYRIRFSDIQKVKQNVDSIQLILPERLVHIESMAVVSPKLRCRIEQVRAQLR